MDEKHANAHEQFFAAIRALSASSDCIQMRLIRASEYIMLVTIDEFENDKELKLKFARILDYMSVDQDDVKEIAVKTAAHMTDLEAVKVAGLICDFFYDLG
jgi:hypothetical protein